MIVNIRLSLVFESGKLKVEVVELTLIIFNVELQAKRDITAEFEARKKNVKASIGSGSGLIGRC